MIRQITTRNGLAIETTDFIGLGSEALSPLWFMLSKRFQPVHNLLELGAGAGMTGLELLKDGFCQYVTLSDIVPECVEQCQKNIELNGFQNRATAVQSDVWEGLGDQRFDFVIFNLPTHLTLPETFNRQHNALRWLNPSYSVHKKLYTGAWDHLTPGAHLVVIDRPENAGYVNESLGNLIVIDHVRLGNGEREFLITRRQ